MWIIKSTICHKIYNKSYTFFVIKISLNLLDSLYPIYTTTVHTTRKCYTLLSKTLFFPILKSTQSHLLVIRLQSFDLINCSPFVLNTDEEIRNNSGPYIKCIKSSKSKDTLRNTYTTHWVLYGKGYTNGFSTILQNSI